MVRMRLFLEIDEEPKWERVYGLPLNHQEGLSEIKGMRNIKQAAL